MTEYLLLANPGHNRVYLEAARTAAAAEISAEALRSYEAGARMPRDEVKLRLARQYRCSIFDLFFNENSTKCDIINEE